MIRFFANSSKMSDKMWRELEWRVRIRICRRLCAAAHPLRKNSEARGEEGCSVTRYSLIGFRIFVKVQLLPQH